MFESLPALTPPRYQKRNFLMHVLDGAFYMGALAFTSTEIVLSVLVYRLGGSEAAIGCVFALTELGAAFPQLLSAPFVDGWPRKKNAVLISGLIQRLPWLVLGWLMYHGNVKQDGSLVPLVLFLISFSFFVSGFMGPGWSSFVAATVPLGLRGRLFALRQAFTGLFGIGIGYLVTWILESFTFPTNFSYLFFITFTGWMISLTCLTFVKEEAQPVRKHASLREYLFEHIPRILRTDYDFRWFLVIKAGMLLSLISFGFYSVYAIRRFDLPPSEAGVFIRYYMIGMVGWSFLLGYIADRFGHRVNVIIFGFMVIAQSLMAILAPSASFFYWIFLFLGANRSIQIITFITMPMEYTGFQDRPTYYALSYTLISPFYLSGVVGGFLIPLVGYQGLFIIAGTFAFLTLLCTILFVKDPRKTRMKSV